MAARKKAVRRKAAPEFTPAFAPQRAGAGAREQLLFELQRARTAVLAAIQGMAPASAERPVGPGRWSPREIVLHLAVRDRARIAELESLRAGNRASWLGQDPQAGAAMNESDLAPLRGLTWEEAVRRMNANREELLAALLALPAEPAALWGPDHPLGEALHGLHHHDRHHAEQIKTARIST